MLHGLNLMFFIPEFLMSVHYCVYYFVIIVT